MSITTDTARAATPRGLGHRLFQAAHVAAIGLGLYQGYEFGMRISGMPLGVLLAVNCALLCSITVGVVADAVRRR